MVLLNYSDFLFIDFVGVCLFHLFYQHFGLFQPFVSIFLRLCDEKGPILLRVLSSKYFYVSFLKNGGYYMFFFLENYGSFALFCIFVFAFSVIIFN